MNVTIEGVPLTARLPVRDAVMSRPSNESKTETKHVRLSKSFAGKLSVIANALTQLHDREVSSAEAADLRLGDSIEREFVWALEQLAKLKKKPPKPESK